MIKLVNEVKTATAITKTVQEDYTVVNLFYGDFEASGNAGVKGTHDKKLLQSLTRAKRNIKDIIHNNINYDSKMITLTYAENMQDYEASRRHFEYFILKLNKPKYIQVKELQKRGAIHYHVILFDHREDKEITEAWTHGFSYIKNIEEPDSARLANYLGKYLTDFQKGQTIAVNKRLYSCSRDCKRTKKESIKANEAIKTLENKEYIKITKQSYTKLVFSNEKACNK